MFQEVLEYLDVRPGQLVADLTMGLAGHGRGIIDRLGPTGRYLGFEWDPETMAMAREVLAGVPNATLAPANHADLTAVLADLGISQLDSCLLDAGPNLWQLTTPHRSLAQDSDEGLDMRLSPATQDLTAEVLVNESSEAELLKIMQVTLQGREARRVTQGIVRTRRRGPIRTTRELSAAIMSGIPPPARYTGRMPWPALLAIRIAVNDELANLEMGIRAAVSALKPETGRLVVLTFHSAEFRVCRDVMRELARGCICPPRALICQCGRKPAIRMLTRRPLAPDADSLQRSGPQCRSCRLHAAQAV